MYLNYKEASASTTNASASDTISLLLSVTITIRTIRYHSFECAQRFAVYCTAFVL